MAIPAPNKQAFMKRALLILIPALMALSCSSAREQVAANPVRQAQMPPEVSETEQLKSTATLVEAARQKMLGNWSQAAALYHEAARIDPRNDAALYSLAKIHAMNGDFDTALDYARGATSLDPANPYYQMVLADIHILKDELPRAMRIYEELAGNDPENLEVHHNLVNVYLYNEKYDKAIGVLNHIETLTGISEEVSLQKQKIWVNQGQYEKAIGEAVKMIGYFPYEPLFYELLGDLYMETGQADKAREVYQQLLERDPGNHVAMLLLADYYQEAGEPGKAFDYLREAFSNPELGVEGKIRIIYSYMRMADHDPAYLQQALELSSMLIEIHPGEADSHLVHADVLHMDERLEEAREMYLQGARLDPSSLQVWQQILSIDLRLADFEAMLTHSDMALEYFFEHAVIFLFNGLANMQLKNYEDAAATLSYGLSLAIEDQELQQDFLTMLGDTHYFLGDHEASDSYYEQALEVNPDNATALNNYSYHLAERKTRLAQAREMSERANHLEPGNAAFQDTYGWIMYQMSNYTEAKTWIGKALENSPEPTAAILEHYGDVMYRLGDRDKAVRYWEKALEAGNGSALLHKKIEERTLYE